MAQDPLGPARSIETLQAIMARLRDPDRGCPWDVEQDHRSIARYCIEEAYEVVDAIERADDADLRDELGDLLLQVVFHARMAEERGAFDLGGVVAAISDKMIRRHPHVFRAPDGRDAEGQAAAWEDVKAAERAAKGQDKASVLGDVPVGLPGLTRAEKLGKRVARVGFNWDDTGGVVDKIQEELDEVKEAVEGGDIEKIREEIGDLLFSVANLTRFLEEDAETIMREANDKFVRRFSAVERGVEDSGRPWSAHTIEELDAYWEEGKAAERSHTREWRSPRGHKA